MLDDERIGLELYARDSFENIQFSLYQFYKIFGRYPVHVTVVGWEFKRERFGLHARTIGIPTFRFSYSGCNNPTNLKRALLGEGRTLSEFKLNPTGDKPPLSDKRKARNPFGDTNPYDSCPPISID